MSKMNLRLGDCLEIMKDIPDGSVDLVVVDPPYGTLGKHPPSKWANKLEIARWDYTTLDTQSLFSQFSRVVRERGKVLIFSQEPYTSELITMCTYPLSYCYNAIWLKNRPANILGCKTSMVNVYENISLFTKVKCEDKANNPICSFMREALIKSGKTVRDAMNVVGSSASHYFTGGKQFRIPTEEKFNTLKQSGFFDFDYVVIKEMFETYNSQNLKKLNDKYPSTFNLWQGRALKTNVLEYAKDKGGFHPTQKPVELLEDLIKTYSNEGDTVLDNCMGSGSTGVACVNTGRNFIGIELDPTYYDIAVKRIEEAKTVG